MPVNSSGINPEMAIHEIKRPVVLWTVEGQEPDSVALAASSGWVGEDIGNDAEPQVEMKRVLASGAHVVVRISAGSIIQVGKRTYDPGVVITTNKAIEFTWREYYTLTFAVEEGTQRLMDKVDSGLAQLGDEIAHGFRPEQPPTQAPTQPYGG